MKKLLLMVALLVSTSAFAATPDVSIKVNGLVCDFCAQSITKLFKKEAAVNDVQVNLEGGLVTLDLKDGQSLDDKKITKLITESGYTITAIERAK